MASRGYDHCQIRSVAAAAELAPSTVYLYFPSKDDLLLACLHDWLQDFDEGACSESHTSVDGYQRLLHVFELLTVKFSESPHLAEAMIRSYLYAQGPATEQADLVRTRIVGIFGNAMGEGFSVQLRQGVADMFTDVWTTNISVIAQQRTTTPELMQRLAHAIAAIRQRDSRRQPAPDCAGAANEEVA
ncbi:TetR/AcrR family transcriptional regulator [Mycolicibacterium fluoranthenivorans]|nr:TetR/AcrR family transcriptional regulator [Mycolicibacterium fluoranthenivorans]